MLLIALLAACTQAESPDTTAPDTSSADTSSADTSSADTSSADSGTATDTAPVPEGQPDWVLRGGVIVPSGATEIAVKDGVFVPVPQDLDPAVPIVDTTGKWLAPAFIDSHVHLAYYPVGAQLAQNGVAAAVDLAAPPSIFGSNQGALRLVAAGPMVTANGGYPTQSWGSGGYGRETDDSASAARAAVDEVHGMGAGVIKLPVTGGNQLGAAALAGAADRAHELGLKVVSHALGDDSAMDAHAAGVDALAHTPTQPLGSATLDAWGTRAVISTLVAFGNGSATRANLLALHQRGATILYGTDLGNTSTVGIDGAELLAMQQAGLSPAQILAAGTTTPAAYWGLGDLGRIEAGATASFLILGDDPLVSVATLAQPERVFIAGAEVGP